MRTQIPAAFHVWLYFFLAAFHFAHRARCAAAMLRRAAADNVRRFVRTAPRVPRLSDPPVSARSAASMRARSFCSCSTMLASLSMRGIVTEMRTRPREGQCIMRE
jgi:hypothetical protein